MFKLLLSSFVLMGIVIANQTSTTDVSLRLEDDVLNLGAIEYGESATGSVKFYNEGADSLIIISVFTDCNCTVPSYTKEPVAPGDSGVISVKFNSRGREAGTFRKAVRIRTNMSKYNKILFVTGRIKRAYRK